MTFKRGDKEESYPQLFVTPKGVEALRKKWDAYHRPPGGDLLFSGNQPGLA